MSQAKEKKGIYNTIGFPWKRKLTSGKEEKERNDMKRSKQKNSRKKNKK